MMMNDNDESMVTPSDLSCDATGRVLPATSTVVMNELWTFRSQDHSLPGTFAPWNFRSLELSHPGTQYHHHHHILFAKNDNNCEKSIVCK